MKSLEKQIHRNRASSVFGPPVGGLFEMGSHKVARRGRQDLPASVPGRSDRPGPFLVVFEFKNALQRKTLA
jgi:hypothetical protein